jgi:FkbM family methyltransferase
MAPFWTRLGRGYRAIFRRVPMVSVRQKIGIYGPFRLVSEFAFSDFANWGNAQNRAFQYCVEACRGKRCVLDVGAHVGLVTLPIATVLADGGRLYSFEPAQANAGILRRHLKLNHIGNVEVVEALVGGADLNHVPFYESAGPHGQNSIALRCDDVLVSEWGGYSKTERPQVSLDSFCARNGLKPEVIKIDVEGAEIGVLRGARATLSNYQPLMILSVHPREIALVGEKLDALAPLLSEMGYDIRDLEGRIVADLKLEEYIVEPRSVKRAA